MNTSYDLMVTEENSKMSKGKKMIVSIVAVSIMICTVIGLVMYYSALRGESMKNSNHDQVFETTTPKMVTSMDIVTTEFDLFVTSTSIATTAPTTEGITRWTAMVSSSYTAV